MASTAAPAAAPSCSTRTPSSSPAAAGRASTSRRWPRRSRCAPTAPTGWCAPRSSAATAEAIWATSSTTARLRPACATASTPARSSSSRSPSRSRRPSPEDSHHRSLANQLAEPNGRSTGRPGLGVRRLPVGPHPADERPRALGVHPAPGREGLLPQLLAAMVDQRKHRTHVGGDLSGERTDRVAQDSQVVVVAQQVRQLVGSLHLAAQDARRRRLEQPQVIPEVLRALAPLMQVLVRGVALRSSQSPAAAAVGPSHTAGDRLPAAGVQLPVLDTTADGP